MNYKVKKAPYSLYNDFRKYFAFSCVDLVIFHNKAVLLTRRTQQPYRGYWHLPGSMIHKDEKITDAIHRSAKEELNVVVKIEKFLGVYESVNKFRHDVSHGYLVTIRQGTIKTDFQSSDLRFFQRLPAKLIPHHRSMILDALKIKTHA